MTLVAEHTETDTRERILVVADRLFRQLGYQKTTVADIAKKLRMSPANVYRFFDSKKSIHEGVARTLMGNPFLVLLDEPSQGVAPLIVEQMADAIVELKKTGTGGLIVRTRYWSCKIRRRSSLCYRKWAHHMDGTRYRARRRRPLMRAAMNALGNCVRT